MSHITENQRMAPVMELARKLDIINNPAPEALFEACSGGFQIWCTLDDHPKGRDGVPMSANAGAFAKPCDLVASVWWGWEDNPNLSPAITHLCLETDAYNLRAVKQRPPRIHNRPEDIAWAKKKIRMLFRQAGVPCPKIKVEKGGAMPDKQPSPGIPIYISNGLIVNLLRTETGLRLAFTFDRPEARGTIILDESGYGLYVLCPDVHPEQPLALLDLFYPSPAGQEVPGGPPLQIEFFSPAQTEDPLGQARCFPEGTRVRFEAGAIERKTGKALPDHEFGYPEEERAK